MSILHALYMELLAPFYLPPEEASAYATNPWLELGLIGLSTLLLGYNTTCELVALRETVL